MDKLETLKKLKAKLDSIGQEREMEKGQLAKERQDLISTLGGSISEMVGPALTKITESSRISKDDLSKALREAISSIQINVPDSKPITIPPINVPQPKVTLTPTFNVQPAKVVMPSSMTVTGDIGLRDVNKKSPLPVVMMDVNGKPMSFSFGGATGGKADFFTVTGITNTVGVVTINPDGSPVYSSGSALGTVSVSDIFGTVGTNIVNPDGRLKVELPTGSSGITDTEIRATALPVSQVSGAIWSTSVTDIFGSTSASGVFNADNRIKVSVETGGSGLTDSELRAAHLDVQQVSGAIDSVNVLTMPAVVVTSITNSIQASLVDSGGVGYSGSNPLPIVGTVTVSGSPTSTISVGATVAGASDDGSAPIKGGGIARTTNPSAVTDGQTVSSTHDKIGRQITRNLQVRNLISTAYVSLTTGTETTLLAAVAGSYLDLIYLMGTNNSDAAVTVDIRAVTAGNIQTSIRVPANGTAGLALPVPIPQDETGNNWTADLPDITGTTVTVSALFSKEI